MYIYREREGEREIHIRKKALKRHRFQYKLFCNGGNRSLKYENYFLA